MTETDFDANGFIRKHVTSTSYVDAVHGWAPLLQALTASIQPNDVMEIGGGRSPLWHGAIDQPGTARLVVNDISQAELDLLPPTTSTARFDVSDPASVPQEYCGALDLVFSKSVMEHVSSTDLAMETTYRLLRPGGVAFHFFPTLWASPFVVNKLVPYKLTEPLVKAFAKPQYERFPAMYRQTMSTERQLAVWRRIGFGEVSVARFYGHSYYRRIPGLRNLESAFTRQAVQREWAWYSSRAYVLMVK